MIASTHCLETHALGLKSTYKTIKKNCSYFFLCETLAKTTLTKLIEHPGEHYRSLNMCVR